MLIVFMWIFGFVDSAFNQAIGLFCGVSVIVYDQKVEAGDCTSISSRFFELEMNILLFFLTMCIANYIDI